MTSRLLMFGVAMTVFSLAANAANAADGEGIMSRLAALEGDWILLDENGEETDIIGSSFRLTSAGSALMERMFPDNAEGHEMLNVFHADGERVLMTHYCGAGNQPRLEVIATDDENRLELQFESITNVSSPDEDHMHQAEYVFHGNDRLTTHWYSMMDGELSDEHSISFELERKR